MTPRKSDSELLKTFFIKLLKRCYSNTSPAYAEYGALGATVCDEWRNRCNAFIDWSLANGYFGGLSLYRIDPRKPFGPDNCQWSYKAPSQPFRKKNAKQVVYRGGLCFLTDLVDLYHSGNNAAAYGLVRSRIFEKKWAVERALITPAPGYQPKPPSKMATVAA